MKKNNKTVGDPHDHRHSCFTNVRMVREMAAKHEKDSCVISADDKCKLVIGTTAVSRLVNLNKFFVEGQQPELLDHDIRTGMLITPNGYMILESKPALLDTRPTVSAKIMASEIVDDEPSDGSTDEVTENQMLADFFESNRIIFPEKTVSVKPGNSGPPAAVSDKNLKKVPSTPSPAASGQLSPSSTPSCSAFSFNECFCSDTGHTCKFCKQKCCNACNKGSEDLIICAKCVIKQLDGNDDTSDSDDDKIKPSLAKKSLLIESDTSGTDDSMHSRSEVLENESSHSGSDDDGDNASGQDTFQKISDELEREHVKYPHTGETYIFWKSHFHKGSDIEKHCNDLVNMFESSEKLSGKPVLILILDDGADYGIRGPSTSHYFGLLFKKLDLDALFVVKNAPKDSKWNPIEHFWGFLTPKLAGVILPSKAGEGMDNSDASDDEGPDDENVKDKQDPKVLDNAIDILHNITNRLEFDKFKVTSVPVKCEDSEVQIKDKIYKNDQLNELEKVDKYYKGNLSKAHLRDRDPETAKFSTFLHKHMDRRLHSIFIRKCHRLVDGSVCSYCRKHPTRSSDSFWRDLPPRSREALFYGVEADPDHPGHNLTYLQQLKKGNNNVIKPDGEIEGVRRCKVWNLENLNIVCNLFSLGKEVLLFLQI